MKNDMTPKMMFLTKGVGRHKEKLASFEEALRDAGIERFNLVTVSSIIPPGCMICEKEEGLKHLQTGQIVFCVMSRFASIDLSRRITASIGVARPENKMVHGYLSEHHTFDDGPTVVGEYAEDLAAEMLATTFGLPFNVDADYDEKRKIWNMSDKIVRPQSITASVMTKDGKWTTVIAVAVFIL